MLRYLFSDPVQAITNMLYTIPALLIAMVFHEFAHAGVSAAFGDPTPRLTGRLSLNPIKHIDPIGAAMILLVGFGWAKPVMVNPQYYKNKRLGIISTTIAGPLTNFLIFLIFSGLFVAANIYAPSLNILHTFLLYVLNINLMLFLFNLIPIPPLDGYRILSSIINIPPFLGAQVERYGILILMLLSFTNFFGMTIGRLMEWFLETFFYMWLGVFI